jgi:hypothetical protein
MGDGDWGVGGSGGIQTDRADSLRVRQTDVKEKKKKRKNFD